MKDNFEKPKSVSIEEAKRLLGEIRASIDDSNPTEKKGPRTGAAAMDEWQRKKEAKEDERYN